MIELKLLKQWRLFQLRLLNGLNTHVQLGAGLFQAAFNVRIYWSGTQQWTRIRPHLEISSICPLLVVHLAATEVLTFDTDSRNTCTLFPSILNSGVTDMSRAKAPGLYRPLRCRESQVSKSSYDWRSNHRVRGQLSCNHGLGICRTNTSARTRTSK